MSKKFTDKEIKRERILMKIDWSKIGTDKYVYCDTKQKAELLINANKERGGNGIDNYFKMHSDLNCYKFGEDLNWYCDTFENCKQHHYKVIYFDDVAIYTKTQKSKIAEILGFEVNDTYYIEDYGCNPCTVDENYELINCMDAPVGSAWLIKAINDPTIIQKCEPKVMTISEIENILGYPIKIVKEKESAD